MSKTPEILVAEDDPNLGLLLTEFLKKKGYHVSWAQNGDEALDLFVKGSFDLCLLDVMMPKKDGCYHWSQYSEESSRPPLRSHRWC
jgi:DNA-binding response OmpR family regulator